MKRRSQGSFRVVKKKRLPLAFQSILWSKSIRELDREGDKVYIIHQILSYGDLKKLRMLFEIYDRKEIREIFAKFPKKIYQPAVFYFIKNFILGFRNKRLRESDYVKTPF